MRSRVFVVDDYFNDDGKLGQMILPGSHDHMTLRLGVDSLLDEKNSLEGF